MKKLIKRVLSILPAVLVQFAIYYAILKWLSKWSVIIYMLLELLSFLAVLLIITKRDESTYKTLWLLVVLVLQIPGTLLYLFFGNQRTARPLSKKLGAVKRPYTPPEASAEIYEVLAQKDSRISKTFSYIQNMMGFPIHYNRSAKYYPLGEDMFSDMLSDLKEAKKYIFIEYFIIEPGFMWNSIVEILAERVKSGVDVRVIYDDVGSISTYSKDNVRELERLGIKCIPFNPLIFIKGTLNYRDHRKMTIIDGTAAYSGGVNLADEYINRIEKHGHWKDIGFRLEGEAVSNYTDMFIEFWNAFSHSAVPQELVSPPQTRSSGSDGYVLSYYDSPLDDKPVSNELYIELLSQAEHYAYFYTPYLMPGDALSDAFVRAAARGVDVRIIMPGIPDKKLIFRMSRSFYPTLLEAGVKIYEYEPGFVHAKACVTDDKIAAIGTVNLDYRSLFLHFENNSIFYGAKIIGDIKADFLKTQAKCRSMIFGENVKKSFSRWFVDGILRLFAPLC